MRKAEPRYRFKFNQQGMSWWNCFFLNLYGTFFTKIPLKQVQPLPPPMKPTFLLLFSEMEELDAKIPVWDWGMFILFLSALNLTLHFHRPLTSAAHKYLWLKNCVSGATETFSSHCFILSPVKCWICQLGSAYGHRTLLSSDLHPGCFKPWRAMRNPKVWMLQVVVGGLLLSRRWWGNNLGLNICLVQLQRAARNQEKAPQRVGLKWAQRGAVSGAPRC